MRGVNHGGLDTYNITSKVFMCRNPKYITVAQCGQLLLENKPCQLIYVAFHLSECLVFQPKSTQPETSEL